MGIQGLTAYIAKNSENYHQEYQLYDSYLVIDGDSIACQLYITVKQKNDCFGGDYDKFAETVNNFFEMLHQCNVIPIVIFDGGYEERKIKTVNRRMRNKIKEGALISNGHIIQRNFLPLFIKDVFCDIVKKRQIKSARANFEADYEIACLARHLNCPLLSYDSDYYIFDVLYIPYSYFPQKTSKLNKSLTKYCLKCQIFSVDMFLKSVGGLEKSNLPLLAALLGNDYIKKSAFQKFYTELKLVSSKSLNLQQKQVNSVVNWLKGESRESAIKKILEQVKQSERKSIATKIDFIIDCYRCKKSSLFHLIGVDDILVTEEKQFNTLKIISEIDKNNQSVNSDENIESESLEDELSTSDSDLDDDFIDILKPVLKYEIPDWFLQKYQSLCYPATFINILTRNVIFCTPQIENYKNDCSHHISEPIMSTLCKILTSGKAKNVYYVTRGNDINVKKNIVSCCDKNLPTLEELKTSSVDSQKYFLNVLNIDESEVNNCLELFPDSWKLYFISVAYWGKKVPEKVTTAHIYALILCAVVINYVDPQIGFFRSSTKFSKVLNKKISDHQQIKIPEENFKNYNISEFMKTLTQKELFLCMENLISYFQINPDLSYKPKLYQIDVLDAFAQLQSVVMFSNYLNVLLRSPYKDIVISDFYNGTFLHNMTVNLLKRNDIEMYLPILLKNCPNVLKVVDLVSKKVFLLINETLQQKLTKKRRNKKKKSNKNECVNEITYDSDSHDFENVTFDKNNKFSILQTM